MADKDELLDHNYDGIQEYDNDLPNWWMWLFILTAVYGVYRIFFFHVGPGLLEHEQLAKDMAALEEKRATIAAESGEVTKDSLLKLASNQEALSLGKEVFEARCVACHLSGGQGLVGPNLTDDYWIHGGGIMDIHSVIVKGVPEKGMISWKGVITDEEIEAVTAYVWTLHGTNPPNPKEPEGELAPR